MAKRNKNQAFRLDHFIEIYVRTEDRDANSYDPTYLYVLGSTAFSSMREVTDDERLGSSAQVQNTRKTLFTIRYTSDVASYALGGVRHMSVIRVKPYDWIYQVVGINEIQRGKWFEIKAVRQSDQTEFLEHLFDPGVVPTGDAFLQESGVGDYILLEDGTFLLQEQAS